jgi:hypothetical protein
LNVVQSGKPEAKEAARSLTGYSFTVSKTHDQSLEVRVIDPIRDSAWDQLIALHPDAGYFHTTAWARVLYQTYKHQPLYLQFFHGRTLAALIPLMEVRSPVTGRRGVCLPFSDACGALIFNPEATDVVRDRLLDVTRERGWRYAEIRGGKTLQFNTSPAASFYAHTLDFRSGAKELMGRFASSVRRAIRKAERSGVRALIVRDQQAIRDFYELHVQTRRRHGLPPQPASFFSNIYEEIIKPGFGFTVVAQYGSRRIAAAIFFRFGKRALFKYGASDNRFQEFRANNLVMWHGIEYVADVGIEKLDFGRTDCDNDGLRRFKLSWGAKEEVIDYFRVYPSGRDALAPKRTNSALHKQIFGRLPLVLNRLAGSMIYPHLD